VKLKFLHSFFSFLLAVLILLSTSSFTIKKHFCSGFLIDSAVFTQVEKCSNEPCSNSSKETIVTQPDCCDDVIDKVEGQEVIIHKKFDDLDYHQQLFLLAFTESYSYIFESSSRQVVPHRHYIPPILVRDFQVFHQDFLI